MGKGRIVTEWFNAKYGFPTPEQLAPREETVKVTLALSRDSVNYFKKQARKHKVPYQRMIRNLVDKYVGAQA
jgi:predicted DNA binding CopG/RHH family protein